MRYKTNVVQVISEINDKQARIQALDMSVETVLDWLAADVAVKIAHRVKQQGQGTGGAILNTRSKNPVGRYGQRHGKARKEKGRQTLIVDLFFTGDMWRNWNIVVTQKGIRGVGFLDDFSYEKAEKMERLYGTPIFIHSDQEIGESFVQAEDYLFREIESRIF